MTLVADAVGGSLTTRSPVFSADSKYLFICVGDAVRVISASTCATVQTLNAHEAEVTGVCRAVDNILRVWTASLDGKIHLWDYADAVLLRTVDTKLAIKRFIVSPTDPTVGYIVTSKNKDKPNTVDSGKRKRYKTDVVYKITLDRASAVLKKITSTGPVRDFSVSNDGRQVIILSQSTMIVYDVEKEAKAKVRHSHTLTCLAHHPHGNCVATGDTTGSITLWFELSSSIAKARELGVTELVGRGKGKRSKKKEINSESAPIAQVPTTTLHWHAHAVASITFTSDGAYLLSGGEEAVLVMWQLANQQSPTFLPRMGAPIESLAINLDAQLVAVAHSDNAIRLVDSSTFTVSKVLRGLCMCGRMGDRQGRITHVHGKGTGLVVAPGMPGSVQFFDVSRDQHTEELEVVPHSYTSRTQANAPTNPSRITLLEHSFDGKFLATVERQSEFAGMREETKLKFWCLDPDTQKYILTTCAETPHGRHPVLSIASHPSQHMMVTTGEDRRFKVWVLNDINSKSGIPTWMCRSVGMYRGEIPHACAFAFDGSLLAVSYGSILTLWEPNTTSMVCNGHNEARGTHIYHPTAAEFAITTAVQSGNAADVQPFVAVFQPSASPAPRKIFPLRNSDGKVRNLLYVPEQGDNAAIVVASDKGVLKVLREKEAMPSAEVEKETASATTETINAYQSIFGASSTQSVAIEDDIDTNMDRLGQKLTSHTIFSAPSHIQPPLHSLYSAFMGLLLSSNVRNEDNDQQDWMDMDEQLNDSDNEKEQEPKENSHSTVPNNSESITTFGVTDVEVNDDLSFLKDVFNAQARNDGSSTPRAPARKQKHSAKESTQEDDANDQPVSRKKAKASDSLHVEAPMDVEHHSSRRSPRAAPRQPQLNGMPQLSSP